MGITQSSQMQGLQWIICINWSRFSFSAFNSRSRATSPSLLSYVTALSSVRKTINRLIYWSLNVLYCSNVINYVPWPWCDRYITIIFNPFWAPVSFFLLLLLFLLPLSLPFFRIKNSGPYEKHLPGNGRCFSYGPGRDITLHGNLRRICTRSSLRERAFPFST